MGLRRIIMRRINLLTLLMLLLAFNLKAQDCNLNLTQGKTEGDTTYFSDGTTAKTQGANTYFSDGISATVSGALVNFSDGTSSTITGTTVTFSDGTIAQIAGNTVTFSGEISGTAERQGNIVYYDITPKACPAEKYKIKKYLFCTLTRKA